jgi:glycosyltransferase involved in cell wall biosynthesis
MMADRPPRRKVLFLTFTYPSAAGTGTQMRSSALLRMLAADAEVHLLVVSYAEAPGGPHDPEMEALCRQIVYLRVPPAAGAPWPRLKIGADPVQLPTVDCPAESIQDWIVNFYHASGFDCLFIFRFDALYFVHSRIESFPSRELDLDELPSRRESQMDALEDSGLGPRPGRASSAAMRIMEKILLPKFERVFVSSQHEAVEVRRLAGYPHAEVLPNIYTHSAEPLESPPATRREIFFVGHLDYPANSDAVVFFCREILPLIQAARAARGEDVLFRVVGKGTTPALEAVRNLPGVQVMGFQATLTKYYAQAAVVVAPLRAGAGTRLKILEAFTHGRPVVSTSIGAQGLGVTDRKNILLADDPGAFASACVELMEQPELAATLCRGATDLLRSEYTLDALRRRYARIPADEAPVPA